jgi:hypothetical protein
MANQEADPLLERADALVGMAKVIASEVYMDALEEFSFMPTVRDRKDEIRHFHFALTIAGVFAAMTRLRNLQLGERREQTLTERVLLHFQEWNPSHGLLGYNHCKSSFERNYDALVKLGDQPQFNLSDPIGMWIAWEVFDRSPSSDEERRFVRWVGLFVTRSFFSWWDEE